MTVGLDERPQPSNHNDFIFEGRGREGILQFFEVAAANTKRRFRRFFGDPAYIRSAVESLPKLTRWVNPFLTSRDPPKSALSCGVVRTFSHGCVWPGRKNIAPAEIPWAPMPTGEPRRDRRS